MARSRLFGSIAVTTALAMVIGAALYVWGQDATKRDGAMDMAMPGMEMPQMAMPQPPAQKTTAPSLPPGYTPVAIAPLVQQRIGVVTGKVQQTPLLMRIRAAGIVRPAETRLAHIHLKTEGWVTGLSVSYTGQKVTAGDQMLAIYSPAFFTAQRDFLVALQAAKTAPSPDQQIVVDAARRRLELWDVPRDQIESLEKSGKAQTALPLRSPISGTVLEKKAFEGQYVTPQNELYMVADLSTVWVQAKLYEYELPHLELGMPVTVTLPAIPDQQFTGKVVFIDPTVDESSRTTQVRVELPNARGSFKPGMFANVLISHDMGEGLTVPTSAVIRTGERDIVYRVDAQDLFTPVQVKISPLRFEDRFQVLEGLTAGQAIVVSANFLIDSESRLRAGAASMAGMPGMEGMDSGGEKQQDMKSMPMPAKAKPSANDPGR